MIRAKGSSNSTDDRLDCLSLRALPGPEQDILQAAADGKFDEDDVDDEVSAGKRIQQIGQRFVSFSESEPTHSP